MIEGLWIVQYEGTQGAGAGVVVFARGRVLGGDYGYTYEGNYVIKDNWIAASVRVSNFLANVANVLGFVGDFDLELYAPIAQNTIRATMSVVGSPEVTVVSRLTRKAGP